MPLPAGLAALTTAAGTMGSKAGLGYMAGGSFTPSPAAQVAGGYLAAQGAGEVAGHVKNRARGKK